MQLLSSYQVGSGYAYLRNYRDFLHSVQLNNFSDAIRSFIFSVIIDAPSNAVYLYTVKVFQFSKQ